MASWDCEANIWKFKGEQQSKGRLCVRREEVLSQDSLLKEKDFFFEGYGDSIWIENAFNSST